VIPSFLYFEHFLKYFHKILLIASYDACLFRIHIELNKEPRSIDESVQEAIIYTEPMKNPNHQEDNHKRVVRQIRNTNPKGFFTISVVAPI
jgi:hypothetical protein